MKKQISTIERHELDYAVAVADGRAAEISLSTKPLCFVPCEKPYDNYGRKESWMVFDPSTNPAHGWPIIHREQITIYSPAGFPQEKDWAATKLGKFGASFASDVTAFGPDGLVAAMRCFCISRLGEWIEIPEVRT